MYNFTKLILTTAIISTSGFATQQDGGTISGVGCIDEDAVMEIEAGIKATMDNKAVIHNYHIIQGPAANAEDGTEITAETVVGDENKTKISDLADGSKAVIQGTSEEKIINYDHIMEEDADFAGLTGFKVTTPTYYRPTGGAKIQGAIDTTNVTVTSSKADLIRAINLHNDGTDVMLLTTDCPEEDKTMRLTNSSDKMRTVNANIANEVVENESGGSNSHSLVIRGDFRFEGDQSRFNQEATTLKFSRSHSEIGRAKSLFMRPIDVFNRSELVIDAAGVEMPHDVTVMNSRFLVNPKASFYVKPGAKLLFKRIDIGYPSEKPLQMSWPEGSFSNELTEVNKNYYTVSFDDGTSLSFFYDEDMKGGMQLSDPDDPMPGHGDMLQFHKTEDGGLEIKTYIYDP